MHLPQAFVSPFQAGINECFNLMLRPAKKSISIWCSEQCSYGMRVRHILLWGWLCYLHRLTWQWLWTGPARAHPALGTWSCPTEEGCARFFHVPLWPREDKLPIIWQGAHTRTPIPDSTSEPHMCRRVSMHLSLLTGILFWNRFLMEMTSCLLFSTQWKKNAHKQSSTLFGTKSPR